MQALNLPEGVPPDIAVVQLKLDLDTPLPEADWCVLSADERTRTLRYRQPADQLRFMCTRAALRHLLAEHLHIRPEDVCLSTNQYGKPSLLPPTSANTMLHFNVTHAGQYAMIALSRLHQLGIDIEQKKSEIDLHNMAQHILSPLEKQTEQGLEFFETWTAKEAVLKAMGLGISEHLQKLSVFESKVTQAGFTPHYRLNWAGQDLHTLGACRLAAPDGYAAALAWSSTQNPLMHFA